LGASRTYAGAGPPSQYAHFAKAMLTHEYTYAYGAVDVCTGELDSLILPHVNTECMQLFLNEVSARHPDERIVMVIDGADWHRSDALNPPENIYLLKLPPTRPSSIRLNTSGTNYVRNSFTTAYSKALMPWRSTWKWRSKPWNAIPTRWALSYRGHGSLARI